MVIEKQAKRGEALRRRFSAYPDARSAFREFLRAAPIGHNECVLLPAYVGWSSREGSGVFDPVRQLGCAFAFYRMDKDLRIDLADVERAFRSRRVKVLVLIHYFGYVDPACAQAVALAKEHGAAVLEDEAHAMLTDLIGGGSGRFGNACIFSLHKMLPVEAGGLLVLNPDCIAPDRSDHDDGVPLTALCEFDLATFAKRRRENALRLHDLLPTAAEHVEPLWPRPGPTEVPQTLPVLIRGVSRDRLYADMNDAGFGVVSLYHTMISEISPEQFPDSHALSRRILNLPVHQDAEADQLEAMVHQLRECLTNLS